MTQAIRDAAQALLDSNDRGEGCARRDLEGALRVALAAPEPADDERVAGDAGMPVVAHLSSDGCKFVFDTTIQARGGLSIWPEYTQPLVRQRDHLAAVVALQARIKALEAENFALAAGQCIVSGGLCGDEGGSQYCSLRHDADIEKASRSMFVARLEMCSRNGDTQLTVQSILALLNDCDMLANRATRNAPPSL